MHGGFEPTTGQAIILMIPARDSASHVQLQFIPKYAYWLNLIKPWWNQLPSLALNDRRFETLDEFTQALNDGTEYCNKHCHPYHWKK